jgi:TetR/AcrR family transcriptional repressor of multidrug resistance operon
MRILNENKKSIVRDKALKMIVEEGFKGLSMQKLAKAANVSPATIYIYYNDRQDLLNQLYLYVYNESNLSALQNFTPSMPFSEGLKTLWLNRFRYFIMHPYHSQFLEQFINSNLIFAATELEDNTYSDQMKLFYGGALKRGEVKELPIEVYWSVAFSPLYQLIKFYLQKGTHPHNRKGVNEQAVLQCLDLVLKALKP